MKDGTAISHGEDIAARTPPNTLKIFNRSTIH